MKIALEKTYLMDIDEVIEASESSENGLSQQEAELRLKYFGENTLPEGGTISPFRIFLKQFKSTLVLILAIAAVISWFVGHRLDTWVIVAAIFVDVCIGFSQEFRAQKAILSLKKSIVLLVKVLRNNELITLQSKELVPGDIMILEEGDGIPADGRIIQLNNFRTSEAALTGESVPVSKVSEALDQELTMADQINMVWKGTFVAGGYARVIVTGTGINTAIGDIALTLDTIDEGKGSFALKTGKLAKQMTLIALASASLIFVVGYFVRGFELKDVLLTSIAALVAAIPEGLNVIFSIVLAIGAKRMAKRNAIIKEFAVTETLGSISTILTDKTGTLTQNSLTVRHVFVPELEDITVTGEGWFPAGNFVQKNDVIIDLDQLNGLGKLFEIAALSNNSSINHDPASDSYQLTGDPTEGALLVMAKKGGRHPEELQARKIDDQPFNSTLKFRATLIRNSEAKELLVTGAPEKIVDRCTKIMTASGIVELDENRRKLVRQKILEWSGQALRVIGLAYKLTDAQKVEEGDVNNLVLAGIVGMIDPPRKDAALAVEKCKRAGIRVVMLTGDHVNTAVAIARASGIIEEDDDQEIIALTESQLFDLDETEFDRAIKNIAVFARLTPRMKMRIAGRLQEMGELIAMTGDGVNDAPALKQADAGIAMGQAGTDTAREAADIVLADNNFSSIVNAIEEGRIVFTNVRQTCFFLITTNIAESMALIIAIAVGLPIPLTVTQLLWLNLVTDGITDVALATEAGHEDVMKMKPLPKNEPILNREIIPLLVINVVLMTALSLGAFLFYSDQSIEKARTAAFIVLAFTQLFNVFNMRSLHGSILKIGFFSNRYVNIAVTVSVLLLIVITEVPVLAAVFNFQSLSMFDFTILFLLSSIVFWVIELYKTLKRRREEAHM